MKDPYEMTEQEMRNNLVHLMACMGYILDDISAVRGLTDEYEHAFGHACEVLLRDAEAIAEKFK